MRIYGTSDDCPLSDHRPAVTIGVFDGVHRGHRKILDCLKAVANEIDGPSMAITFSIHPRQALGRSAPPGICSLETRLKLLAMTGIDAVWVLPFDQEFSMLTGKNFAEEYFHRRICARAVVLGEAASFGHGREGTAVSLAEWSRAWNIRVVPVPPLLADGKIVSSTAIRLAVQSGHLRQAEAMLGRPFAVEGTVVRGQGHGRHLGFPTMNLDPHHELRPPAGVYITRAVIDGVAYPSLTNIGRPPTDAEIQAGASDLLIETHLLDFQGDLYGRTIAVVFHEKIRDVMHFPAVEGLIHQVERDRETARRWFAMHPEADCGQN